MDKPIPISITELRNDLRTIIGGVLAGKSYILRDSRTPVALITGLPKIPNQQNGTD